MNKLKQYLLKKAAPMNILGAGLRPLMTRMAIPSGIGALYGAATPNQEIGETSGQKAMRMAAIGAGVGMGARPVAMGISNVMGYRTPMARNLARYIENKSMLKSMRRDPTLLRGLRGGRSAKLKPGSKEARALVSRMEYETGKGPRGITFHD